VRFTEIDLFGAYIASDVADDGRGMVCHDRTAPDRQPIRLVGVRAERFRRRLFGGGFHGAAIGVAWRGAAVGRRGDCGWNPGWRDGGGWYCCERLGSKLTNVVTETIFRVARLVEASLHQLLDSWLSSGALH
jgi:hypothetical protein